MPSIFDDLSRRERQIMEIIYTRGEAAAAEVNADGTLRVGHEWMRQKPALRAPWER